MKTTEENVMADNPKQRLKARLIAIYVFLGAALFAFIQSYSLLSPILLSFLLVMLISLAVNPLISWIRSLTGGRRLPAGLVVMVTVFFGGLYTHESSSEAQADIMHFNFFYVSGASGSQEWTAALSPSKGPPQHIVGPPNIEAGQANFPLLYSRLLSIITPCF